MRIGFFVPRCTPDNSHGRYIIELAKRLALNHQVAVYAGEFWPQLRSVVECHTVPVSNRPAVLRIAGLWAVSMAVPKSRFDIIHIQGADAPVGNVVTAHCCNAAMQISAVGRESLTRKLNYALGSRAERYCFAKPSTRMVIAVSEKVKVEIQSYYDVDPERIVIIPQGVDADTFTPAARIRSHSAVRERLGFGTDDFVVTFVGGDYRLKGLVTLLKAVSRARREPRVIAVGVTQDAALDALIVQGGLKERVKFIGWTSDPSPFYAAADCFVLPTRYDTFSLATLEAMASGLPVIVSSAAGVSEHLTDGLDAIVLQDPGDVESLVRQLDLLTSNEALRNTLGDRARQTAERFSWEKVAERTLEVYRQVV